MKNKQNEVLLNCIYSVMAVIVILMVLYVRVRLLDTPLERDEGEYAYAGQLILSGLPPYQMLYNMKMPGIYTLYSAIIYFTGQTTAGIHFFLLIFNAVAAFFVFIAGKRFYGFGAGLAAALIFALMGITRISQGLFANAEHFLLPFALGSMLLLAPGSGKKSIPAFFMAGVFAGIAFIIKQHGLYFVMAGFLWIIAYNRREKIRDVICMAGFFAAGFMIVFGVMLALLARSSVIDDFLFWTVDYASKYAASMSLKAGASQLFLKMKLAAEYILPFMALFASGLLIMVFDREFRKRSLYILFWALFAAAAVSAGLYFRWHYFVYFLPFGALAAGAALSYLDREMLKKGGLYFITGPVILAACVSFLVFKEAPYFFKFTPNEVSVATYTGNPFCEARVIAEHIEKNTQAGDTVAVFGSEPEIFFYSKRRSATGFIYMYHLMESHKYAGKMQDLMAHEIKKAEPEYVVFVNVYTSWLVRKDSDKRIFGWAEEFLEGYEKEGAADMLSPGLTGYMWGEDAKDHENKTAYWINIYRKSKR